MLPMYIREVFFQVFYELSRRVNIRGDTMIEKVRISLKGHLTIYAYESMEDLQDQRNGTVLLDQDNAVDRENMSILIARAITHREDGTIFYMYFGDGGATIDPLGNVILNPPIVTGAADLYDPIFSTIVDDEDGAPDGNDETMTHVIGTQVSTAIITAVVGKNQPFSPSGDPFVFNEIGLKTADGLLLTHVTFTPVSKTATRIIQIVYKIVVSICETTPYVPVLVRILTGQQATTHVGTIKLNNASPHLIGVQVLTHVGTLKFNNATQHLVGVQAGTQVGTFGHGANTHLIGVGSTSQIGSLDLSQGINLVGLEAHARHHRANPSRSP
jgi:hypothetical protein